MPSYAQIIILHQISDQSIIHLSTASIFIFLSSGADCEASASYTPPIELKLCHNDHLSGLPPSAKDQAQWTCALLTPLSKHLEVN
jgi:hypothetical protein